MKQVGIREARADLPKLVKRAQRETHVITHHGKPAALLVGVEGYDYEDLVRMLDPAFWKMLAERRASTRSTLTLADLDERLARPRAKPRAPKNRPARHPRRKRRAARARGGATAQAPPGRRGSAPR